MKTPGPTLAAVVLFVCGAISPLGAQQTSKPPKPPPPPKAQAHPNGKPPAGAGKVPPASNVLQELDRFSKMSPQEREKALSKLPPQRRAAFEQRLEQYEKLPPEERARQRQIVEEMESLPKDRQNAVKQEIQRVRALPGGQRLKALSSEDFKQRFSPDEQRVVLGAFPVIQKRLEDHH